MQYSKCVHILVVVVDEDVDAKFLEPTVYASLVAAAACANSSRNSSVINIRRVPPLDLNFDLISK